MARLEIMKDLLEISTEKRYKENHKDKHLVDAGNGWYYYKTYFAMPIYENDRRTNIYNVYSACMVVNCTKFEKMYLYDLVDIKKEASTLLKTIK